jgi:hypothetical protein
MKPQAADAAEAEPVSAIAPLMFMVGESSGMWVEAGECRMRAHGKRGHLITRDVIPESRDSDPWGAPETVVKLSSFYRRGRKKLHDACTICMDASEVQFIFVFIAVSYCSSGVGM